MARARNLKPGFFTNGDLLECSPLARILFAGLWCEADRRGILEDRPKTLKIKILPGDNCDVDELLGELEAHGFIRRYQVGDIRCIFIPNFEKHQNPHINEKPNSLPAPEQHCASTVQAPEQHRTNPAESLLPITESFNGANALGETEPKTSPQPIYSDDFLMFWKQYPTGHGTKKLAFAEWRKLKPNPETQQEILYGLARWNACEQWQLGYVKDAERFLKNRMWEDEPPPPKPRSNNGVSQPRNKAQEQMDMLKRIATEGYQ